MYMYVEQDGADFYLFDIGYRLNPTSVVTYPSGVSHDSDMAGATNARKWFTQAWCPQNNVLPRFE